jgi:hypothetical protein
MSGAFGGRERGLITVRTESDAEVKTDANLVFSAMMVLTKEVPLTDAEKAFLAGSGKTGRKASDPSPAPAADKGGKPAGAGTPAASATPDKGGKPAGAATDAASKPIPETRKVFERYTVTLPAVPFRLADTPAVKKADPGKTPRN